MKAVAYSLYGANPKYAAGSCKNAILAQRWYPDYKAIFWVKSDVPRDVVAYLKWAGAIVKPFDESLGIGGMFHRFLVNDLEDCERYLIRDTDSRICEREVLAVRAWEKSGSPFHVVRDHPHHNVSILGGVWGSTKGAVPNMLKLIKEWTGALDGYDADQQFLRHKVWPLVKAVALQHDTCLRDKFAGTVPFPVPLAYKNPRFCCEVFDAQDRPRSYDWEKMLMYVAPRDRLDKTKPLFIRTHLGLGDAIVQNGLIRALATKHHSLIFPIKHWNVGTIQQMFSDLKNVTFPQVDDDTEADTMAANYGGQKLMLGMFSDRWNDGHPGWDELIYKQANVPFELRWSGFRIGQRVATEHKTTADKFALIHEDVARGYTIPKPRLPEMPSMTVWPSGSLLDFLWLIENAAEIHCIDSSVACLVDSVPTKATKLVLHLYARPNAKPPTYQKEWIILDK